MCLSAQAELADRMRGQMQSRDGSPPVEQSEQGHEDSRLKDGQNHHNPRPEECRPEDAVEGLQGPNAIIWHDSMFLHVLRQAGVCCDEGHDAAM